MAKVKKPLPGYGVEPPATTESVDPEVGVATQMWVELKRYPSGTVNPDATENSGDGNSLEFRWYRLWLKVDDVWTHLNLGKDDLGEILQSVQSAFCNCPDNLEVVVWYNRYPYRPPAPPATSPGQSDLDYRGYIVGLVVRSKWG